MFRFLLIGVFIGIVLALLFRRQKPPPPMLEEIHPIGSGDEARGALPAADEARAAQREVTEEHRDG